jgi:TctA family transporter
MDEILAGFTAAFYLNNIAYCFVGVLMGTAMGVLPGIGSVAAVSMLLPISYHMDPTSALIMLAGVFYGSEYGGATASILLNLPGTPTHAVTCLDGYPMSQNGRAGVALFTAAVASFFGGTIGILVLMALTPAVIALALAFGPAEYLLVITFGLVAAATIAQGSPLKGLAMVTAGVLVGLIGIDVNTGIPRFELGFYELFDGVSLVALAMGLFGIAEVIASAGQRQSARPQHVSLASMLPSRTDVRRTLLPAMRGAGIGCVFGPLPGTGAAVAAFFSYALEKRVSRTPERFGTGIVEGIAGPEASNNAAVQTAFIPTLAIGVPGTASMAILLGALMVHGIVPGPRLMTEHADLFWSVVASFWIGNVLLLVLNIPLIGVWVRILMIPRRILFPVIVSLICLGTFSVANSAFDVWLLFVIGLVGYVMRLLAFEPAPLLLGFVLGPMLEENFRRAMLLSRGELLPLFYNPVGLVLIAIALATVLLLAIRKVRATRRAAKG